MIKNELIEKRDLAKENADTLIGLAETEKRKLTDEETKQLNGLKEEFINLNGQIEGIELVEAEERKLADEKEVKERQEAEIETAKNEAREAGKEELLTELRSLSLYDANKQFEEAEANYDKAYDEWVRAWNEKQEAERKEEIKSMIREVINETSARSITLKEEGEEQERILAEETLAEERRLAEEEEAEERRLIEEKMEKKFNLSRALVNMAKGESLNVIEASRTAELTQPSLATNGVFFGARDFNTTDQDGNIDQTAVMPLSIIGKEPVWQKMGCRYLPNLQGNITLPYKTPIVAELLVEKAAVTHDTLTNSGVLLAPARFSAAQLWTKELLASENPALHNAMVADMLIGVERQISTQVYAKALAGATEVAATTLTKAGLDLLMGGAEVENDGVFASTRTTFFQAKSVKVDEGSGVFLATMAGKDKGATYEGTPYFYSTLFADGADQRYVVYGDFYEIVVADWGMYEIIVNPYTYAKTGQVEIVVSRIANVAMQNPAAFSKTVDLDPAT